MARKVRRLWVIAFGVTAATVLAGLLILGGGLVYTSSPSFCGTCHVMSTRFTSWERSSHAGRADCLDCHSEAGPLGEVKAHLNGLRYLSVMLTGEKTGTIIRASVPAEVCGECHPVETLSERTRFHPSKHRLHRQEDITCTDCHGNLVHGTLRGSASRPPMETCFSCHQSQEQELVMCGTCHPLAPRAWRRPEAAARD